MEAWRPKVGKCLFGVMLEQQHRLYDKVVFCGKGGAQWVHYSEVFYPTKFRPSVIEMRVMLYAYYPGGVYWFDNVAIRADHRRGIQPGPKSSSRNVKPGDRLLRSTLGFSSAA